MIIQNRFKQEEDGWVLVRTYSDRNKMIMQDETGELYAEAVDPDFMNKTYTETEIDIEDNMETPEEDIPVIEPPATINDYSEALRRLGVEV